MRRGKRSDDSSPTSRKRQTRMGRTMAKSQRKFQEASAHLNPVSARETKLIEDLLLMIRRRMSVSHDAGMSRVRLDMITPEQGYTLIHLLERVTRN